MSPSAAPDTSHDPSLTSCHPVDPRPHVAALLELSALGWHVAEIRPDRVAPVLWRVTIRRYDGYASSARVGLMSLRWHDRAFDELTARELHAIYVLRVRVFVVEQACVYQEVDELDLLARHVWAETDGRIAGYLRIIPAGAKYDEVGLGRIVTAPEARGTGLGRELILRSFALTAGAPLRIAAQAYLERFYTELGFVRVSDVYDDDGIPHIDMTRPAS